MCLRNLLFQTLDPDLTKNLQFLHLYSLPVGNQNRRNLYLFLLIVVLSFTEFVKWILPLSLNIHTLNLFLNDPPQGLHNEISRLKKLKDLNIGNSNEIFPTEVTCVAFRSKTTLITSSQILRNCRQVEILRVESVAISQQDLADLEHYKKFERSIAQICAG